MGKRMQGRMRENGRSGVTLVETLVVVAVIGGVASLLLPAVQLARESARGMTCQNNLRQIGIGFHNYHSARDCFPNNVSAGTVRHHWCAQILPYLDENPLAGIYDYTVRFDDAKNMAAVQTSVAFMTCPTTPTAPRQHPRFKTTAPTWWAAVADYAGSDGPSSALWNSPAVVSYPRPANTDGFLRGSSSPGEKGRRIRDLTDGTSKSIAVFESAGRPQVWAFGRMVPDSGLFTSSPVSTKYALLCGWADTNQIAVRGFRQDMTQSDPANQYKSPGPTMINGSNNYGVYAFHPNAATFLFVDGAVRSLDASTSADVVSALLTIRGEESVTLP